jgi:ABC-type antimicrobial peptide transport system permease subunit
VSGNNDDNGDDDGQGHQFVIKINGHVYLYTLVRSVGHIDVDDLAIHELTPTPGHPLNGAPALSEAPTDSSPPGTPEISPAVAVATGAVLATIGLAAGLFPARRAANLNVVDCLRA